ncbi:MAG: CPBP family intramembrane glutamic endopeptidase [Burkholderiaceae bacterium]
MADPLLPTLSKLAFPALGIAAMLFAARRRKLSFSADLGFAWPKPLATLAFLVLWAGLIAAEEWLSASIDGATPKPWADHAPLIVLLRVVAIGVLGPVAEELAFRGFLLAWLRQTRLGVWGAIVVCAALWSALHVQYAPALLLLIFVDGLVLGAARHLCRSLWVPIVMHVAGNLFSISQSLAR